jgi:Flp pilus assembly protein TadG
MMKTRIRSMFHKATDRKGDGPRKGEGTRKGEGGATLLETAIVLPMLVYLALGMAEIGFLVIDHMAVSNAAREGARVGAAAGTYTDGSITADTLILRSVEQAVCHIENGAVTFVTIYKANVNGNIPTSTALQNIYRAPTDGILNCSGSGVTTFVCVACPWTPASRDNTLPTVDDVGVQVQFLHDPIVGIFPFTGTLNVSDKAVMRIEPDTRG